MVSRYSTCLYDGCRGPEALKTLSDSQQSFPNNNNISHLFPTIGASEDGFRGLFEVRPFPLLTLYRVARAPSGRNLFAVTNRRSTIT